jgi:hypothetical protein
MQASPASLTIDAQAHLPAKPDAGSAAQRSLPGPRKA